MKCDRCKKDRKEKFNFFHIPNPNFPFTEEDEIVCNVCQECTPIASKELMEYGWQLVKRLKGAVS